MKVFNVEMDDRKYNNHNDRLVNNNYINNEFSFFPFSLSISLFVSYHILRLVSQLQHLKATISNNIE